MWICQSKLNPERKPAPPMPSRGPARICHMRTLLVIAPSTALSKAIRAALNAEAYRIIDHESLKGDELRHMASSIDVCVVDAELTSVEAIRTIERYRRALPGCPMILYAAHSQWDWEEDHHLSWSQSYSYKAGAREAASFIAGENIGARHMRMNIGRQDRPRPLPQLRRRLDEG